MISVGTDMVEISRIEKSTKNDKFLKFILGKEEYNQLQKRNFSPGSVAANFCAKEAFLKSLGMGLGKIKLKSIQVLRSDTGKPYIFLVDDALVYAQKNNFKFSVSLTHTKDYASAVVICYEGFKEHDKEQML